MKSESGFPGVVVGEARMARRENGEVVPIPILPCDVMVVVPVAPKAAVPPESVPEVKRLVPVALPKKNCDVVNAVELAYGNCDAATVDEEKKTPWLQILVVVAAVEVEKVVEKSKAFLPAT